MFYFVVRHLRFLARVPGFPHLFNAWLVVVTWVLRPLRLEAIDELERVSERARGYHLRVHRFGGTEIADIQGHELGHVHGNGLLDVRVGKRTGQALIAAGKARPHHVFPDSIWVSFQMESVRDLPFALTLLEAAAFHKRIAARG